ncbi:MAG: hypothetical protein KGH71_04080 [Candidatus Micrarchaeota archaeon]|nr:hypothetical protein [Candidatus Micrarchaeota archaeon]
MATVTRQGFRDLSGYDQRVVDKAFKDPETAEVMLRFAKFPKQMQTLLNVSHRANLTEEQKTELTGRGLLEVFQKDANYESKVTPMGLRQILEAEVIEKTMFRSGISLHSELLDAKTISQALLPPTPLVNSIISALNFMTGQNRKPHDHYAPYTESMIARKHKELRASGGLGRYFSDEFERENVYSIIGPKGYGKTFDILNIACGTFGMGVSYHSFKQGVETSLEIPGAHGLKLNVFDDFHYLLDYVRSGKVQIETAVGYLREAISNSSALTFVVSNEPLSGYRDLGKEFVSLARQIEAPERRFEATPITLEDYVEVADFYQEVFKAEIDGRTLELLYLSTSNLRVLVNAIYATEGVLNARTLADAFGVAQSGDPVADLRALFARLKLETMLKEIGDPADLHLPNWTQMKYDNPDPLAPLKRELRGIERFMPKRE